MSGRSNVLGWLIGAGLATGCGAGTLPGHYFDVSVSGAQNSCTDDPADYSESYEYRLELAGNDLALAIGDAVFATGRVEGCALSYTSLVWSDYRDDKQIRWQITGEARVDVSGGDGCVSGATDWEGTETFVVVDSEHPDVAAGCTYTLDVTGGWLKDEKIDEAPAETTP